VACGLFLAVRSSLVDHPLAGIPGTAKGCEMNRGGGNSNRHRPRSVRYGARPDEARRFTAGIAHGKRPVEGTS